ncbi:ABC transporter ATP-binding protein [Vallitalea okinawensis]|uniref:ABC transporter ATP-binding protein n=1 Tax=Vallitalea okinawensis TaxID=2078660 RepID=UPI000CFDD40B|nr:dipeptide ABC transporter ATP-binding protein [Vallitalea okinawensis]
MSQEVLLQVNNLKKYFPIQKGFFKRTVGYCKAVDGVDFSIHKGETLSIVGESGCGKSTTGKTLLRLLDATEGEVYYKGENIYNYGSSKMKQLRTDMQIIFQDPYSSLNPRRNVMQTVGEALKAHNICKGKEIEERVIMALERSGLSAYHMNRYPHEFSGGQRQRIGIARALALEPEFIVADEPVSALDVSIQAQVINLMMDLQEEFGFSYLFISHDLSVVKHISDRVAVMYLGNIVELADTNQIYKDPKHPYTKALIDSIPAKHPRLKKDSSVLEGDIPSPSNPPEGCKFHTRCPYAQHICKEACPAFREVSEGHFVACHIVK